MKVKLKVKNSSRKQFKSKMRRTKKMEKREKRLELTN